MNGRIAGAQPLLHHGDFDRADPDGRERRRAEDPVGCEQTQPHRGGGEEQLPARDEGRRPRGSPPWTIRSLLPSGSTRPPPRPPHTTCSKRRRSPSLLEAAIPTPTDSTASTAASQRRPEIPCPHRGERAPRRTPTASVAGRLRPRTTTPRRRATQARAPRSTRHARARPRRSRGRRRTRGDPIGTATTRPARRFGRGSTLRREGRPPRPPAATDHP